MDFFSFEDGLFIIPAVVGILVRLLVIIGIVIFTVYIYKNWWEDDNNPPVQ